MTSAFPGAAGAGENKETAERDCGLAILRDVGANFTRLSLSAAEARLAQG